MQDNLTNQVVLKTIIETDVELTRWAQRLAADRELELGDDPDLIQHVESDFTRLARNIRLLRSQFDLARVPLTQANEYYTATRQIDQAVTLARTIRQKARGSQHNTRQCLAQITLCINSVRRVGDLVSPISTITH